MFKILFRYRRAILRHANDPLAKERASFLSHLAARGTPTSTLLRYARQLRVISLSMLVKLSAYLGHVDLAATQKYLTWTPELRTQAKARFARYALGGSHE